jgi:hypothetical protein
MTDIFAREPDPLDDLLAPPPAAGAEALREELLGRTTRLLRRRRRLRRLAWAAALAACYGAGLLTVWWAFRPAPPAPRPQVAPEERATTVPAPEVPASAVAVEERAADDGDLKAQAALYRRAGDLYLREANDLAAALRCYGNALDAGGDADLAVAPSDNWLLMSIKNARQKEKRHAHNGG